MSLSAAGSPGRAGSPGSPEAAATTDAVFGGGDQARQALLPPPSPTSTDGHMSSGSGDDGRGGGMLAVGGSSAVAPGDRGAAAPQGANPQAHSEVTVDASQFQVRSHVVVVPPKSRDPGAQAPAAPTYSAPAYHGYSDRVQTYERPPARVLEPGRYCCTKVGNTILICGRHPSKARFPVKCLVGPDWPCLMCTYTLIIVPNVCAFIWVFKDAFIVFPILSICFFLFSLTGITLAACTDPGIVPKQATVAPGSSRNICRVCNVARRPGTLHCHDCNCCVEEMDHHCPWTGKCIGKRNLQFFYTFLTAISVNLFYVIAGVFVSMGMNDKDD